MRSEIKDVIGIKLNVIKLIVNRYLRKENVGHMFFAIGEVLILNVNKKNRIVLIIN